MKSFVPAIKTLALSLAILLTFILALPLNASANVPSVSVSKALVGADTEITISVTHLSPSATHYINQIEIAISNSSGVHFDYLNFTSQATETFSIGQDLGTIPSDAVITVKAHCNVHGWSSPAIAAGQALPNDQTTLIIAFVIMIIAVAVALVMFQRTKNKPKTGGEDGEEGKEEGS